MSTKKTQSTVECVPDGRPISAAALSWSWNWNCTACCFSLRITTHHHWCLRAVESVKARHELSVKLARFYARQVEKRA